MNWRPTTSSAGRRPLVLSSRRVLAVVAVVALIGAGLLRVADDAQAQSAAPSGRTYATTAFLAKAISVQLERGWNVLEDSRLHLSLTADSPDYRVLWSTDASALHAGKRVAGVSSTTAALIRWLRSNRDLRVVEARRSTIGSKVPARVVDVRLASDAVNDDPGCPARTCVNFLRYYGASEPYGIAGDDAIRFYFADIIHSGKRHLLIIAIEAKNRADLATRLPTAERLIHSAKLAVEPG